MAEKTEETKAIGVFTAPASGDDGIKSNGEVAAEPVARRGFDDSLLYKLDRRLLVPMFFLNFISLMGRTNIGATLIRLMPSDLHLDATKIFLVLTMPVAPLILLEVPSNLLMRLLERRWDLSYMSFLCLLDLFLGIVTIGQGFVHTFGQMMVTRFLVGVFDAGLIPGCIFVCSLYYPASHLQWRLGIVMVANISSNIVGNFLAYAVSQIQPPSSDFHGWRWIFIVEGAFTVAVSLACSFSIIGQPNKAKFLSAEEKLIIAENVENASSKVGIWGEWKIFLGNPLNYCWAALYCLTCTTTYSVAVFSPSFVRAFHPDLSVPEIQAQVVPIFVVSSTACLLTAFSADRLNHRCGFGLLGFVFTIVGFSILRDDNRDTIEVTMMALYFIAIGTFTTLPMIWSLTLQNLPTPFQRAIGSGFVIGVGNVAGYISAWIFRTSEGPYYEYSMTIGMILTCVGFAILSLAWAYMVLVNRRQDREQDDSPTATREDEGKMFRYRT